MNKFLIVALFTIMFAQVTCWWEQGHILVAQIAKDRLIALNKTIALNKST
jgi:hypothetical protein